MDLSALRSSPRDLGVLTATHVLIPAARKFGQTRPLPKRCYRLQARQLGTQEEKDLGTLLYEPRLEELLGEDLAFVLQSLLVERFGINLRNRMTHSLMKHNEFASPVVLYLWWLYSGSA